MVLVPHLDCKYESMVLVHHLECNGRSEWVRIAGVSDQIWWVRSEQEWYLFLILCSHTCMAQLIIVSCIFCI